MIIVLPMSQPSKDQDNFSHTIERLKYVMQRLRDPDTGCPWDREQTNESILRYTLEEAYEVADAIENGTNDDLKEELGDLLFQVMFYAQIASEQGHFGFDDIVDGIANKMISRHPHVFGDVHVDSADEVYAIWDAQKDKEKTHKGALDGVTRALPALLRAHKLQKKAAKVGFEWNNSNDAFLKVEEEITEFKETTDHIDKEEEFGDLLFALVNFGRMEGLNAEEALRKASNKFVTRFEGMERDNSNFNKLSLDEMLEAWKAQK